MAAIRSAHKLPLIRPEWNSHLENLREGGRSREVNNPPYFIETLYDGGVESSGSGRIRIQAAVNRQ